MTETVPPPVAVKALPVVVRTSRLPPVKLIAAPPLLVSVTPLFAWVVSVCAEPLKAIVPELQLFTRMPEAECAATGNGAGAEGLRAAGRRRPIADADRAVVVGSDVAGVSQARRAGADVESNAGGIRNRQLRK